ncbi:hypothetical protein ACFU5O_37085 [Streptomyces sp. NPDC057445]|uniref:hypothetical protein n=1 Tax=Streptomyces sp. NPDC057445 TaxID=3346136 RepID=UPI0036A3D2D0
MADGVVIDSASAQLQQEEENPPQGDAMMLPGPDDAAPGWVADELLSSRKQSAATLRAFASTMLPTSLAAIGVHFSILKYLGAETRSDFISGLAAGPAVLLLAAAAAFAWVLRPEQGAPVTAAEFRDFREQRLARMFRWCSIGFGVVLGATVADIALFSWMLR